MMSNLNGKEKFKTRCIGKIFKDQISGKDFLIKDISPIPSSITAKIILIQDKSTNEDCFISALISWICFILRRMV